MFFLTDIDPNARVRGSRDPLGTQSVWSTAGRRLVGNLTTQTSSLTDFRVLVIGAYLEDRLGTEFTERQTFLCWEQLAAYVRVLSGQDEGFRGVTKARQRVPSDMRISPSPEHHLLGHQLVNGVWGLYRAAAWRGGLLREEGVQVTDTTLDLVLDRYIPALEPHLGANLERLRGWIRNERHLRETRDRDLIDAVGDCLLGPLTESERTLYRDRLVQGGASRAKVGALQEEVAGLLLEHADRAVDRDLVELMATKASEPLREELQLVLDCESVLAPAAATFALLTQSGRQRFTDVCATLSAYLIDRELIAAATVERLRRRQQADPTFMQAPPDPAGRGRDRWLLIADAMLQRRVEDLFRLLVEQNVAVSRERGATVGWVQVTAARVVDVHQRDPNPAIPTYDAPTRMWSNGYFLPQLRSLAADVEAREEAA